MIQINKFNNLSSISGNFNLKKRNLNVRRINKTMIHCMTQILFILSLIFGKLPQRIIYSPFSYVTENCADS